MFKLMKVHPAFDSPFAYGYVDFNRRYTVREFIEETLENQPGVSGQFSIDATTCFANYHKGKLLNELPEKILNAKIAAVSFYAEWNKADYVITKLEGQ